MRQRSAILTIGLALLAVGLNGCSFNKNSICSDSISVAGVTMSFSHGLDGISEGQYSELQSEVEKALSITMDAVRKDKTNVEATRLAVKLKKFVGIMDRLSWDFSKALLDINASTAASDIGSTESLQQANAVESYVISICGLPSTVENISSAETLPMPTIASPDQTDPQTHQLDPNAANIATGRLVAGVYGLSVSDSEALCLANALSGVVDATSSSEDLSAYTAQFDKAFRICGLSSATSLGS